MNIKTQLAYTIIITALSAIALLAQHTGPVNVWVETDKPVLKAAATQRALVKVSLMPRPQPHTAERTPINLAIVLDRSGSMQGTKIKHARQAAIEAIERLGHQDMISIISYANDARTDIAATPASEHVSMVRAIERIHAAGHTALYAGVNQGAAELRKHLDDGYFHRIILLSDGRANQGPSTPADLKRLGRALAHEGISVSTVGIGNDYNEDLMAGLAQMGDGNTYFVENYRDLPRIFQDELGDALNVAAHQVEIEIRCGTGIVPLRVIGRDATISGQRVQLDIQQLYNEQEKYVLLEVEVPATPADKERTLLEVNVNYTDFNSSQHFTSRGQLDVRFTVDDKIIADHANVKVAEAYAENEIAIALDEAIKFADSGNKAQAAQRMQQARDTLASVNSLFGSDAIDTQAAWAQDQFDAIQQEGINKRNRKAYRTQSYRLLNQQKE